MSPKYSLAHLVLVGIALLMLCSSGLYAQPEEQRFRSITIDDGLSQSTVVAICQDSLGFMWFGTKSGLNLYNGYDFKVFQHTIADTASLGGNNILSLVVDRDGKIWAGAGNGTISIYCHKSQSFTHITLAPIGGKKAQLSAVQSLTLDNEGNVWAGTLADGLYHINSSSGEYVHYQYEEGNAKSLVSNTVNCVYIDPDGVLWVGTYDGGLCKYNPADDSFERFTAAEHNLTDFLVYAIFTDMHGTIWVGTENGASYFDKEDNSFHPLYINPLNFKDASVTAFAQIDSNYLWLAVYPQGLVKLNLETREWVHYYSDIYSSSSLNYNDVRALFVDRTQNLWIGTNGGGINMLPPYQNFTLYRHKPNNPASLLNNSVRAILETSDDRIYIGVYGGLMIYDKFSGKYTMYESTEIWNNNLRNAAVYSLAEDTNGHVLLGLEGGGMQIFDPIAATFKAYFYNENDSTTIGNNHVLDMLIDSEARVWVGTHKGLDLFNRETGQFRHFKSINSINTVPYVRSIIEDVPGYLWLGTDLGLFYFEIATGNVVRYKNFEKSKQANSEVAIGIHCLYKDANGVVWIATQGSGLYRLDYKNQGLSFTQADFSPIYREGAAIKSTLYGILEDKNNNLWLSSDDGLHSYNKKEGTWRTFTKTDGLQSNEFNASAFYRAKDDKMYFGGINGLNAFYPDKLKFIKTPPPVVLTGFKVYNKPYPLGQDIALLEQILLNYDENYITFEFAALDYTAPEQNKYAYKLVGFDEDWIYPGTMRQATYSNLPPGEYAFRVKASNKDGYWNENGVTVNIDIVPAIWSTIWFKFLLVLIALMILYLIFRARLVGYQEKEKLLEEQLKSQSQKLQLEKLKTEYAVSQALIEGQNQEQKRISEDLHDGLGQTLTAASLNLMALETSFKDNEAAKTDEYLSNLQLLMGSAIQEVRNISHNLMPFLLAEEGLQAALDEMCNRAMKYSTLQINMQITGSNERIGESNEINLYRIAQEVISNAQKHSGAQNLMIKYHVDADEITWHSVDDGIGFDPGYLQGGRGNGLGLKNIQVRVQLMQGTIKISTKPGKGVTIDIRIPR